MSATPKGWGQATVSNLPPVVTISELGAVTGLSRWTIRGMLDRYQVPMMPRYGKDARRYQRKHVLAAIQSMPGKGRRRQPTP